MCGLSRSTFCITEGKFVYEETESYAGQIRGGSFKEIELNRLSDA
jgi:hypothetical protein